MDPFLSNILERMAQTGMSVVEPVRGRDGPGAVVCSDGACNLVRFGPGRDELRGELLLVRAPRLVSWDVRRMLDWPLSDAKPVWDVGLLHGR